MNKYRKKPVVIEAMKLNDGDYSNIAIRNWLDSNGVDFFDSPEGLIIKTLEGDMLANYGDWIIKGVEGEFYPCKPAIFDATYELIDEDISLPEDYWETAP